MADIKSKPWNSEPIPEEAEILAPKGMIGPEERHCFYWLAKHALSDRGCIVDAGSFVGASTLCFAAGAAAQGRRSFHGAPLVHAFDYFKVIDAYVGKRISQDFRPIQQGDSYLDIFEKQTEKYRDVIRAYDGDFLDRRWRGEPIEILFIDLAKTAALNAHVFGEFFPHLIPGHSIIVQQDYFHCWHSYIHIAMEYLSEELELIDEHVQHQSRIWRLSRPVPSEKIARLRDRALEKDEQMALLDRLVEKSSAHSRPMMEVVRMRHRCGDHDHAGVFADMARLRKTYGVDGRPELWFRQALEVEKIVLDRIKSTAA